MSQRAKNICDKVFFALVISMPVGIFIAGYLTKAVI